MNEPSALLSELLHDHGDRWRITRSVYPAGWIAVQHSALSAQQVLLACSLTEMSEKLSGQRAARDGTMGDVLPPGFVRAVLEDARYSDLLMDAFEARVVALEEVAAARAIRRLRAARRLGRSLRASVRHFTGRSFTDRRYEAASTEWGST